MRAIRILQANWLNDEIGGDRGTVKLVRDEMAYDAVEVHHIAEYAPEHDREPQAPPPPPPAATEVLTIPATATATAEVPEDFPQQVAQFMEQHDELLKSLDDSPAPVRRPYGNESKAAWIDWAVRGEHDGPPITADEAAQLTKNELMNAYGERL